MRVAVVTLFPELFTPFLATSFVRRAIEGGQLSVTLEDLRPHGLGKHLSVDDTPYGGGAGMVMRVDCLVAAIEAAEAALGARAHRVLLTPVGERLVQHHLQALAARDPVLLIAGRYEGFDERVASFVDQELSLGDFVLTGGEVAAMALLEGTARLLPGVLGNADSPREESFSHEHGGLLEYPQYTRPAEFRGLGVPEILKSGDHAKIAAWRHERALERTRARRPDLLAGTGES
ncbi:MAG: tRNA (guanosine(37)-N1)-methyltransferase TrmD [Polyangiaceae bacterium]|nr:tRNA (guanosine(37)-N1)-methyltransferase TrmD [Polyangiaceae bacterium]